MPRFYVRVRPRPTQVPRPMLVVGVECAACGDRPMFWYETKQLVWAIATAEKLARDGGHSWHGEHEAALELQPPAAVRDALLADAGMNLVHVASLVREFVELMTFGTVAREASVRDELNYVLDVLRTRLVEHDELLELLGKAAGAMDRGEHPGTYQLGSVFAPAPSPVA